MLGLAAVLGAALVMAPASGAGKPLTKKKADKRYVNANEQASDSELLDGMDSVEFLSGRAQNVTRTTGFSLTNTAQQLIDLEEQNVQPGDQRVTTPRPSWILGTATVSFVGTGDPAAFGCTLTATGPSGTTPMGQGIFQDVDSTSGEVVSVTGAMLQPAGTYDVGLECAETAGDVSFIDGTLTVWTVPQ